MVDLQKAASLAVEAFGAWALQAADAEWADEAIPHEPTRSFLTTTGLPVQALNLFTLDADFEAAPRTLDTVLKELGATAPLDQGIQAAYGHLIVLGDIAEAEAYLDPATGTVLSFVNWTSAPFLLNSGVADFVYFLAYIETHRRKDGVLLDELETSEGYAAAAQIAAHLATVDPAAFQDRDGTGSAWANWVEDGFAIGLFQDWEWDGAIDYFLRHGIDPTAREPRRALPWHMTSWPGGTGAQ